MALALPAFQFESQTLLSQLLVHGFLEVYHGLHPGKNTKKHGFTLDLWIVWWFSAFQQHLLPRFLSARPPRPVPWDPSAAAQRPPGRCRRRCSAAPRRGGRDEERKKWKHLGFPWDFHGIFGGILLVDGVRIVFHWSIFLGDRKLRYIKEKYDLPCLGRQVVSCSFV